VKRFRRQRLQTADRLRVLRVRLTVLLLAINIVGLAGMGAVALTVDSSQRDEVVASELRRTAGTAVALLQYDSGSLRLGNLFDNPVAQGSTAVYVFEADRHDLALVFAHPAGLAVVTPQTLLLPARQVRAADTELSTLATDVEGRDLHLLAVPFRHANTGAVAGAVVVVSDPAPGELAHRSLLWALLVGGTVFTLLTCGAGYVLAHRGTQPVAIALAQQERFVADAAHELRTPLTVMRAVSEAAVDDSAKQADALRRVLRSTDQLTESVAALLIRAQLVAGIRALERQPFRLDQLVEEVAQDTVQPPHLLSLALLPVVLEGDPALVRIAVRNLINNAVQHGRHDDGPAIIVVLVEEGQVTVRDRGPGLGATAGAPPPIRGTGFGLAITRWVAELHGGSLRLESAAAGGVEATLRLAPGDAAAGAGVTAVRRDRRRG
jgi:two-component system, OmpR family, sensor kinase